MDKGMLMKYQPPNIGNIRDEFHDEYGYRGGGQLWITSLAVHKGRVPEKDWPRNFKDALDPKWKGRVAIANPATAGPGVVTVRYLVDLYGWEYFRELGKNDPILTKGGSALEQLLLSGEADLNIGPNEFSIAERIKKGETNLQLLYPEEGTSYSVMWLCINKDAPHPNAAKLWMEFTASDVRQEFVTKNAGRYITSKNVALGIPRPPLKFHKLDWQWLKVHKDDMAKRFIEEIQKGKAL
jgi:iron(III) transport system substrate-binding protein